MDHAALAIARVCYEACRAFGATNGQYHLSPWDSTPEWRKADYAASVLESLRIDSTPQSVHEAWTARMKEAGWKFGNFRAPEILEHPGLVSFDKLNTLDVVKLQIIMAISKALQDVYGIATAISRIAEPPKEEPKEVPQDEAIEIPPPAPVVEKTNKKKKPA